ncbi:MAG: glycosyltransferase family 4 protein [Acidobacteriia bacterium]|nr:glycosyltransferase family 4 protein [Terriglobia bacterium]
MLIVKSNLEPFRIPFYGGLEKRLAQERIVLQVAVPLNRCGSNSESWLVPVRSGDLHFAGRTLSWQGISKYARHARLVIVQQCARELTNYWLLALRKRYGFRLALWGHGAEFQRRLTTPLTEFVKREIFASVDFWFAYTPGVAKIVESTGFPSDRICTVYNSTDTKTEVTLHRSITEEENLALRASLGMGPGAKLVCYCGGLYKAKRLDFLIDACRLARNLGTDVHLAVLGDGPEEARLAEMSREAKWIHVVGPTYGKEKALYLAVSECMTIPGVVGLAVVDAFAHECPLVTTAIVGHGPEIEYLLDGVNGLKTADSIDDYAHGIIAVLTKKQVGDRLRQGCREAASAITIENMVEHFAAGVLQTLGLPADEQACTSTSRG